MGANVDKPFNVGDEVMRINVYYRAEDAESIDLDSVLFVNPNCNPEDYAPAFAQITAQFHNQFLAAIKRSHAQRN